MVKEYVFSKEILKFSPSKFTDSVAEMKYWT